MVESTGTVSALVPLVKSRRALSSSDDVAVAGSSDSADVAAGIEHEGGDGTGECVGGGGGGGNDLIVCSELNREVLCPICMQVMKDAFLTACGHSFCHMCIVTHLRHKENCPCCGCFLVANYIFPNFALDKLLKKISVDQLARNATPLEHFRQSLSQGCEVSMKELDNLLHLLTEKKRNMERDEAEVNMQVMLEFLQCLKRRKLEDLNQIQNELKLVKDDIDAVRRHQIEVAKVNKILSGRGRPTGGELVTANASSPGDGLAGCDKKNIQNRLASANTDRDENDDGPTSSHRLVRDNACCGEEPNQHALSGSLLARKRRIHAQFNELQECYLQGQRSCAKLPSQSSIDTNILNTGGYPAALRDFQSVLSTFTRYSRLRVIAELRHDDLFQTANIVSSIEFDRDGELFATAGVSKCIKVFEFSSVVNEATEVHCPIVVMSTRSKLSCLSWNRCSKNHIASSDYDGTVTVWDIGTRQSLIEYEEHEKRTWSVDFSCLEPSMLVSGSDDCKVKIWCTKQEASVLNIEMKANICCVKFNPGSSFHVAVGSADHQIHYYDLRNTRQPVQMFTSHRKAVSYVRFLSSNELASASTDSTLRLWDVKENSLVRSYRGHANEKNFVGLTVNNEYIACGSETNEVVVYHKAISRPAARHHFTTLLDIEEGDEELGSFTSAVCWKSGSPTMVAANSQGTIKVLALSA